MTRQEAITELSYIADEMPSMECGDWKKAIYMAIKALEQEPKEGHWYRKYEYGNQYCSECNHEYIGLNPNPKFCEECGAKMESEE